MLGPVMKWGGLMLLPVLLVVALTVYVLFDVWSTPEAEVLHLPQPTWMIVVVALPVLGPVAWLLAGKRAGSTDARRPASPEPPRQPTPPPRARFTIPDVLPDVGLDPDDPEDRWLIEQRDRQRAERAPGPDVGDGTPASAADPRPSAAPGVSRPAPAQGTRAPQPRRPQSPGEQPRPAPRDAEPPTPATGA